MVDINKAKPRTTVWLVTAGGCVEWQAFNEECYAKGFLMECEENGWEDAKMVQLCPVSEREADKALIAELVAALNEMANYADDARSPYVPGSGSACDWNDSRDKKVKASLDLIARAKEQQS